MKVVNQMCVYQGAHQTITNLFPTDSHIDNSIYETIERISPNFNETFIFCKLFDKWINCNEILFPFLTDEGFCYTFNAISLGDLLTDQTESYVFE